MNPHTYSRFISFEGLDFSGKTTQIHRLIIQLARHGISAEMLREPGGTPISEAIRKMLLDNRNSEMTRRSETLLFSSARAQLVEQVLVPRLEGGETIIADRYVDSTTAYQGYGRQMDGHFIRQLNAFATGGVMPFRTFFLDVSVDESLRRRRSAGRGTDRMEGTDIAFMHRVRDGFHEIAAANPGRFLIVNAERPEEKIAAEIWGEVSRIWQIG